VRRPSVVLVGSGGVARALAAAGRALRWTVVGVAAAGVDRAAALAHELDTEPLALSTLRARRVADVVLVDRGDGIAHDDLDDLLGALERGHHLVVGPPLAATSGDADALVAAATRAWARGTATLYGDAVCAAPVIAALLARAGELPAAPTHLSSRSVRPDDGDRPSATSPMADHGAAGVAAILLAARRCGLGPPIEVRGRRTPGGEGVLTDIELRFRSGLTATVHASWGPPGAPVQDLQLATPDEVLRVEMFPRPALERNGTPVQAPGGEGGDPMEALGYLPMLRGFWSDVAAARRPVFPAAFGREVLQVIVAADADVTPTSARGPSRSPRRPPR
jgi:predicted dehydrogenase